MKSREKDMREEMRAKEGGKRGMGDVPFFYLRPSRSRVLARLALFTTRKGKLARRLICY